MVREEQSLDVDLEFFLRASKKSLWIGPVQSLSEERLDYFFLPSVFFFSPTPPGGLFYWDVQDLQRVNRPDRPGRFDRWAEGEGDRGQAQRVACSVHCRRWLREERRKPGRVPFMPLWMDCTLFRLLRPVSNGQNLIISLFPYGLISPHSSCTTLPYFILRLSATQSSWNATLTKPSAKCIIISQYVFLVKESKSSCQNQLTVTLLGFRDVYKYLFLK